MVAVMTVNTRLARLLHHAGIIPARVKLNSDAVIQLVEFADAHGIWLGRKLVEDGHLTGKELADIISREQHIPLIDLSSRCHDCAALELLDTAFCQQHDLLPLQLSNEGLHIVMANPMDVELIDLIKLKVERKLAVSIAPMETIRESIERFYAFASTAAPALPEEPAAPKTQPEIYRHRGAVKGNEAEDPYPQDIFEMLAQVIRSRGSDLHLTAGTTPLIRINGALTRMNAPKLKPHHVRALVTSLMTGEQEQQFEQEMELDFSFGISELGRFRANIYMQRGSVGAILRAIPDAIPSLDSLRMPPVLHEFTKLERGLVLVTGPTGSGKSTTLASIVDEMNRSRYSHIVTLEDPIEYVHWHQKCEINQRQVGMDTRSFLAALKHVLRQDPDIILIGELRDLETIAAAMTAAETGHVVFSTLHTNSAPQTIDRIIDVFPPEQQPQIRMQLASVIEGVVSQKLLPRMDGSGRVCAQEILIATPAVRTLIRDGKTHQLPSVLESGGSLGMQTMDKSLLNYVQRQMISLDEAMRHCNDPEVFKGLK